MPLKFDSYAEIHKDSASFLDFAVAIRDTIGEADPRRVDLSSRVEVGGKPFSVAMQMSKFEGAAFDNFDEPSPDDLRRLHKASEILTKVDPNWDIRSYLTEEVQGTMKAMDKVQQSANSAPEIASRACQMLGEQKIKSSNVPIMRV